MDMPTHNLYEILEIPEAASQEEIKKAYRQKSLKYHPDKNLGKPECIQRFQEVSEAFEILGNPDKKRDYDMRRNQPSFSFSHGGGHPGHGGHPIDEVLSQLFFGGMAPSGHGFMSTDQYPDFFLQKQAIQKPTPIIKTLVVTMHHVLHGGSLPIEIERWMVEHGHKTFEKQTIYVTIPEGIDDGEMIILRGEGNVLNEQNKGDIKVVIKVEPHPIYKRHGLDILIDKTITLKEALCGFQMELEYLDGKKYLIKNVRGNIVGEDHRKSISKMGLRRNNHVGTLHICFHIEFPKTLSEETIQELEKRL